MHCVLWNTGKMWAVSDPHHRSNSRMTNGSTMQVSLNNVIEVLITGTDAANSLQRDTLNGHLNRLVSMFIDKDTS